MEGIPYDDNDKPTYEKGREIIEEQVRSSAEIMANNPPFQYNYNATEVGIEESKENNN